MAFSQKQWSIEKRLAKGRVAKIEHATQGRKENASKQAMTDRRKHAWEKGGKRIFNNCRPFFTAFIYETILRSTIASTMELLQCAVRAGKGIDRAVATGFFLFPTLYTCVHASQPLRASLYVIIDLILVIIVRQVQSFFFS